MKYIILILLSISVLTDPGKIGKINRAKTDAQKAFNSGDYKKAIQHYRYLVDSLQVSEDEVTLNLANAYYLAKDTAKAQLHYQSLADSPKGEIRSKAQQQLGIMANRVGKSEEALSHFKQALKANPANEDARYNYELLKKKLDEKKKQEDQQKDQNKDQQKKDEKKDQQNKDQQKKDQQDQQKKDEEKKEQEKKEQEKKEQEQKQKDQQNKDQKDDQKKEDEKKQEEKKNQEQQEKEEEQKKDQQQANPEKLEQMKITEEKARMILEAMKNQEKQYLQQNKRKATKPKDKGKPDW
ncbi:MAG: hypothetical protein JNM57_05615 [Cyclobacteriaceae bacterium]|nr:hypothetical protein [Cyclobacteriaceae bacterium]